MFYLTSPLNATCREKDFTVVHSWTEIALAQIKDPSDSDCVVVKKLEGHCFIFSHAKDTCKKRYVKKIHCALVVGDMSTYHLQ